MYRTLAGEEANIIFGAMYDDSVPDTARITVIATGLDDATARQASVADAKKAAEATMKSAFGNAGFKMPTFQMPQQAAPQLQRAESVRADHEQCAEEGYPDSGFPEEEVIHKKAAVQKFFKCKIARTGVCRNWRLLVIGLFTAVLLLL